MGADAIESEAIVETRFGPVRGAWLGKVYQFRGVPFAQPPVGELRLAPPTPPSPWSNVRDATSAAAIARNMPRTGVSFNRQPLAPTACIRASIVGSENEVRASTRVSGEC